MTTESRSPVFLPYNEMTPEQKSAFDSRNGISQFDRDRVGRAEPGLTGDAARIIRAKVDSLYVKGVIERKGWTRQQAIAHVEEFVTVGTKQSFFDFMESKPEGSSVRDDQSPSALSTDRPRG